MRRLVSSLMFLATAMAMAVAAGHRRAPVKWEPIGLSGGGGMFTPAISPVDPMRMMVNCDMSAAYLTSDGGYSWQMINHAHLRASTRCKPAFHPTDPNTIYAASGYEGLKVTRDFGAHWQKIGNLPADLRGPIAIDPQRPARMLAGAGEAVYRSGDAGVSWTKCDGPAGEPLGYAFDLTAPADKRTCFAATVKGVWRSGDGGVTWQPCPSAGGPLLAFAGGSDGKETVLYCSIASRAEGGKIVGGIYRSLDGGRTWGSAMGEGLNLDTAAFDQWAMGPVAQYQRLATCDAQPRTVYAANTNTGIPPPHQASIYRSDDAGITWHATYQGDPRFPGCRVDKDYITAEDGQYYQSVPDLAVCASTPNTVVRVDVGNCYVTMTGGRTWQAAHTRPVKGELYERGAHWVCNGLVVTTTWNFYVDPFQPDRQYICYTDIGFSRSLDRGRSWLWWPLKGRAPWNNTCYELAFDPSTPGKIWGAFSNTHDIPNGNIIFGGHSSKYPGGVCVSSDFGATWTPSNQGLPLAACTSVVVDPRSPAGTRTLYAGVFGQGAYRSTDDGRTWQPRSSGLGAPANMRVDRVYLHRDGTLFALITGMRENRRFLADGVGLYRSRDGGGSWELVNRSQPLLWPKDFTVDPRDSRTIYLSGCDANGEQQAGLYRTKDGGATWQRLARKGAEHFGAYLHPKRPGWIYMTLTEGAPGAGLWLSKDDGATWAPMNGLPFSNAQRVTVDPADPDVIYVTTFGGSVWRGPASE